MERFPHILGLEPGIVRSAVGDPHLCLNTVDHHGDLFR